MRFSLLSLALAASSALAADFLGFTGTPTTVEAGETYVLNYTLANADAPATITLRRGMAGNLDTIAIITNDATGTSYTWTVDKDLADDDSYALQISQGLSDNYSGMFSLTGGSDKATSTSSTSASSTSRSRSASASSTALAGGTLIAPGSGGFKSNRTMTGTGMGLLTRNSTLSRTSMTVTSTMMATTDDAAQFSSTRTSSSPTASSTSGASAVGIYGSSPLALVMCIFAAIMA